MQEDLWTSQERQKRPYRTGACDRWRSISKCSDVTEPVISRISIICRYICLTRCFRESSVEPQNFLPSGEEPVRTRAALNWLMSTPIIINPQTPRNGSSVPSESHLQAAQQQWSHPNCTENGTKLYGRHSRIRNCQIFSLISNRIVSVAFVE